MEVAIYRRYCRGRRHAPNTVARGHKTARKRRGRLRTRSWTGPGIIITRAVIMIDWLRRAGVTRGRWSWRPGTSPDRYPPQDRRIRPWTFVEARVCIITNHCDFLDNRCTAAGAGKLSGTPCTPATRIAIRWPTTTMTTTMSRLCLYVKSPYSITLRPDVKEEM